MRIFTAGIIATVLVISIGVGMIAPVFLTDAANNDRLRLMIIVDLGDTDNDVWTLEVTDILRSRGIRAVVFTSGDYAYTHPELITSLDDVVDLGSETQSYANLTQITDYTLQLSEVADGKSALDGVAGVDSRIFRAPYGSTNEDIYSILSRSGILADFSYPDHYNKWINGQFIRVDLPIYTLSEENLLEITSLTKRSNLDTVLVIVNDSCPSQNLAQLITRLEQGRFRLINASDLLQFPATIRR